MSATIKHIIEKKFSRAASTYDKHCHIQNSISQQALTLLTSYQHKFTTIADFACGTGESTQQLIKSVQFNHCHAIDLSQPLLGAAHHKLQNVANVSLLPGDYDSALFPNNSLDLIFCNMGLQWAADLHRPLNHFYNYLRPDGWLLFTLPIAGNFPEIYNQHKPIHTNNASIIQLIKNQAWQFKQSTITHYCEQFSSQLAALQSLKAVGANFNAQQVNQPKGLSRIALDKIFTTPAASLTYKIGTYLIRKNPCTIAFS